MIVESITAGLIMFRNHLAKATFNTIPKKIVGKLAFYNYLNKEAAILGMAASLFH
ncbi:hypothetical protein [Peribacillus sp. NPDC096448]|uniref:hypothetical protein n=1 Tax=Peribacillus sp. NPDC096448 TaxID=3364395 RepID=UPI0037FF7F95